MDFPDQNWAIKAIETLSGEYRLDCMDDAAVTGIHIESGLDMQQQYLGTNL